MNDQPQLKESAFNIPGYVDPQVLRPGTTVVAVLDAAQTRLVVLRVEPMLVCRTPDGREVTVFAHEVTPTDDAPIPFRRLEP